MQRRYQVFDVFTDSPLAGNALAVVLDAEGLGGEQMQAIAREFRLSETAFILPPRKPAHAAQLRIFTPAQELSFAGHPTVGSAVCLGLERFGPDLDAVLVLEEGVGPVRCGVKLGRGRGFAEFDCPALPEQAGSPAFKEAAAAALHLAPAEIGFENHRPSVWSVATEFHFVPVRNLDVLGRATVNSGVWADAFGSRPAFIYTRETRGYGHSFAARMFAPHLGIPEDPATGSAVAAFAGVIQFFDANPDGVHLALIEQGYEMSRPSHIQVEMTVSGGELSMVRIGGSAVRVMQGTIEI
jgi:trans-2,3-dihydro-3-hydroxyanthranilate isomerase